MIRKLLNGQSKTITAAAVIIGSASLLSRALGVLRDRVLASEFGAGPELDMYFAAFRIPDLIYNLLILGALSAGFIPVFTSYLRFRKRAWELVSVLLNVMVVSLVLLFALLAILAPWVMRIIAPGFTDSQIVVATAMTRIMFLSPFFLGISGILGGVLQSFRQFFVFSLSPIFYNVGIIFGALFLVSSLGIYGLAWGVVLGAFLHMVVQIPSVHYLGYRYRWVIHLNHRGLQKLLAMMVPRTLTLLVSQLNIIFVTAFSSTLAIGSIAIYTFANNLQSLPLGLFGVSFAVAAFPTLTDQRKNTSKFVSTLSTSIRQILFLIIPSAVLLVLLRAQIVRLVLGAGLFDWEDTILTLRVLSTLSVSLFAQALILLLARAFYAFEDSRTPFIAGLISFFANVLLAMMFIEQSGIVGLALAFTLSSILNLVLLWLALHYRVGRLDGRRIALTTLKIIVASFLLGLTVQAVKLAIGGQAGTETFIALVVQAAIASFAGIAVYLGVSWLLGVEEIRYFTDAIQKRFIRKARAEVELIESE